MRMLASPRHPALLSVLGLVGLVGLAIAPPVVAAPQTLLYSGTVSSSGLDAVTMGTVFSGSYTVDDATVDTNVDVNRGDFATGSFVVDIDGVGGITIDSSPETRVRNNQPQGGGVELDSLRILAGEGSRTLTFSNVLNSSNFELASSAVGSPTTLTTDSLAAALMVALADWTDGGQIVLTFANSGEAVCTAPLVTECSVVLDIAALGPAATLTVTKDGTGTGAVTSVPAGIDCGATCAADFFGMVTLTATPDPGSIFVGWTGCDSTLGNTCTVDVTSARAVNATFDLALFALTVTKDGTGTGTVTSAPAGIDCGATCAADFVGMVTLTATPDAGSVFVSWTGCDSTVGDTCFVDVAAPGITVNATFDVILAPPPREAEIPTLSEWGLAVMLLLLAVAGVWYQRTRA